MNPELPGTPGQAPPLVPIDPDQPGPPSYDDPPPPSYTDEPPQTPSTMKSAIGHLASQLMTNADQINRHAPVHHLNISRAAIRHPVSGLEVTNLAWDRAGQNIQRIVLSVALGIIATGCYGGVAVEPHHPARYEEHHETRREEQREEPRQEHRDEHRNDEHHD